MAKLAGAAEKCREHQNGTDCEINDRVAQSESAIRAAGEVHAGSMIERAEVPQSGIAALEKFAGAAPTPNANASDAIKITPAPTRITRRAGLRAQANRGTETCD